jgi:FkbM family methyltransferase
MIVPGRSSPAEALRRRASTKRAFNSRAVIEAVRSAKRMRRTAFERIGSDRYSRPSCGELEPTLAQLLPQSDGVFVEAGAYDGYFSSNTYWLERFREWTGVLIEPIPELAQRARRERPRSHVFQCALVAPDAQTGTVTMWRGGAMSLIKDSWGLPAAEKEHVALGAAMARQEPGEVVVPTRTLSQILDQAEVGAVDLLSLDVEGHEVSVLRGLDLARHAPRVLLVEMLDPTAHRPQIEAVLGGRYRYHSQPSELDHLYVRAG